MATPSPSLPLWDFYSFDTSAIINGRRSIFLPGVFDVIWEGIAELAQVGAVAAVDEVRLELERKEDDAAAWAKSVPGLFVPLDEDVQLATLEVLAAHPKLLGLGGGPDRNAADPFVVALALARNGTVVTQELPRNLDKPRIPDVCEALGVLWMTLPEFVAAQDWTITRH